VKQIISLAEAPELNFLKTQICIIGSGPGGGIPAATLAKSGHQIILLEAGPLTSGGGALQLIRDTEISGVTDLPFMSTVQLGGSSNLWAGRIAPLEPVDFEYRDWVPCSGWPLSFETLPYGRALHMLTGAEAIPKIENEVPAQFATVLGADVLDLKRFYWAEHAFNVARHLVDTVNSTAEKLRILYDSPVVELVESKNGDIIEAANVRRPDGRVLRVEAKLFILAAGGIETPRILLSSRHKKDDGIGNQHDLVGRFLSTHPKADIATLKLSGRIRTGHPLFSDRPLGAGRTRLGLGFGAGAQRRLQLLNHYVQLTPFLEYRASRVFEKLRISRAIKSPFIDTSKFARGLLPSLGLFAFEAIGRLSGLQGHAQIFTLRAFLDQYPNPANRITLSGSYNKLGLPTADIAWTFTQDDRASVVRFLSALDAILQGASIGRLYYQGLLEMDRDWPLTGIHSHYMGTTRMGETEKVGVVDKNCRVFGIKNLYVSGPSVFSAYGYANPFLTITALACRLADHVHKELSGI